MSRLPLRMFVVLASALALVPAIVLGVWVARSDISVFELLRSGKTWTAIVRTLGLGAAAATLAVAISVPIAWLTHATDLPGRRVFRVVLNLPLAVPSYVGAFVIVAMLAPGGVLEPTWTALGLPSVYGGIGATMALLFSYPLALLPLQAALARTDPRLWESGRSLGHSPWSCFRLIILPTLRPSMATGALLIGLYAIGDFGAVSLMRFKSLSYLIYVRYKSLFDRDEAAALSLILVAVAVLIVLVLQVARGRVNAALSSTGTQRTWPTIELGGWRWPAFAFCFAVAFIGVGLPLYVVGSWLVRGLRLGLEISVPWSAIANSVRLGLFAGLTLVLFALIPALGFRYGGRSAHQRGSEGRGFAMLTNIGYALPGIVVALAIVWLAATRLPSLYQTVALLIIAFVIRFYPLALQTLQEAIAAQNRGLFWAARAMGRGPIAASWQVVLPNARPALAAAFLAVFVAVIKELPLTLLLSPPGYETLSTQIWMLTEDAYFAAVSPVVFSMLFIATVVLLMSPRRFTAKR